MHANKPYRVINKRTGKEYNYNRKGKGAKRLLNKPGTIAFDRELEQANADDLESFIELGLGLYQNLIEQRTLRPTA